MADEQPRPLFHLSHESRVLYEFLAAAEIGDLITYDEMTDIAGVNVRNTHRWALDTARRRCSNLHQIVFGTITGKGIRRLSDAEIVSSGDHSIDRVRRESTRAVKRLSHADYDQLTPDQKIDHNTKMCALQAYALCSRASSIRMLRSGVADAQKKLPVSETLKLFGRT